MVLSNKKKCSNGPIGCDGQGETPCTDMTNENKSSCVNLKQKFNISDPIQGKLKTMFLSYHQS